MKDKIRLVLLGFIPIKYNIMIHKPTFFIVGAPRSGTTAMYEYLRVHPQIYMPDYKAPSYFATDLEPANPWAARYRTKKGYFGLFDSVNGEKQVGTASDLYLYSKVSAKNIKKFNPKAKIIIMLRSPVEVMYSFFNLAYYSGVENVSTFEEALLLEESRKKGKNLPENHLFMKYYYYYRDVVRFSDQVKRFFKLFPRNQIEVIIYDDFKKDALKVYKETLKFLGVDESFVPNFKIVNGVRKVKNRYFQVFAGRLAYIINLFGPYVFGLCKAVYDYLERLNFRKVKYPSIDPNLEKKLKKEFAREVGNLGKIVGRDLSYWSK